MSKEPKGTLLDFQDIPDSHIGVVVGRFVDHGGVVVAKERQPNGTWRILVAGTGDGFMEFAAKLKGLQD